MCCHHGPCWLPFLSPQQILFSPSLLSPHPPAPGCLCSWADSDLCPLTSPDCHLSSGSLTHAARGFPNVRGSVCTLCVCMYVCMCMHTCDPCPLSDLTPALPSTQSMPTHPGRSEPSLRSH
ncbi:hypothetical protein HJG60_009817 [Phyllostomus discolor]|uniref:Uncharacterized protein n=1 Tax=Phyllostomus discolor TaxID=89673 RepID=A0A834BA27_9CHIR|nr:hypothetical protein HJG60_009817 [Phyllostomus discolor]